MNKTLLSLLTLTTLTMSMSSQAEVIFGPRRHAPRPPVVVTPPPVVVTPPPVVVTPPPAPRYNEINVDTIPLKLVNDSNPYEYGNQNAWTGINFSKCQIADGMSAEMRSEAGELKYLGVKFGNGTSQIFNVSKVLKVGQSTGFIDFRNVDGNSDRCVTGVLAFGSDVVDSHPGNANDNPVVLVKLLNTNAPSGYYGRPVFHPRPVVQPPVVNPPHHSPEVKTFTTTVRLPNGNRDLYVTKDVPGCKMADKVKVTMRSEAGDVKFVRLTFANRQTQTIGINRVLRKGATTGLLDIPNLPNGQDDRCVTAVAALGSDVTDRPGHGGAAYDNPIIVIDLYQNGK